MDTIGTFGMAVALAEVDCLIFLDKTLEIMFHQILVLSVGCKIVRLRPAVE